MDHNLITFMVLLPFVGALAQAGKWRGSSWLALGFSAAASLCAIVLVASMQAPVPDMQASEHFPWIGSYAITYDVGVDGLNALPVLLVAIIFPLLIAAEWNRRTGIRGMHALFLLLQSSLFGAVCSQDLFLMFFFWALSLLPFYFLIGIWGGQNRETAALRTIISGSVGNALIFGALVLIYYSLDPHTFSMKELAGGRLQDKTFMFLGTQLPISGVAFGLLSLGLALRAPIWPLHGWFTQTALEAPASAFVALSAVSVPVAAYIFIRLSYSLFPDTVSLLADGIVLIGAVNLVVGGVCALAQRSLKLLLAFVCVSELGLILIGVGSLSSAGVVGAMYQVLTLGLALAGFGLFIGIMAERTGQSQFLTEERQASMGGIASQAPALAIVAGIIVASILGFPGSGGFVGHSMLVIGTYSVTPLVPILAGAMLLLAAYYLFAMYRNVFLGKFTENQSFADLTLRERAYLIPLVASLLIFGLYPMPWIELVRPTVLTLLSSIK